VVLFCLQAKLPMRAMAVHGALMIISFAVLLPAALLAARHKWLFIDQEHVSAAGSANLVG
jgi:hypothetical protein